jgi:hypothetical protein
MLPESSRVLTTTGERALALGIAFFVLIPAALVFLALEFIWAGFGSPKIPSKIINSTPSRGTFWKNRSHCGTTLFPPPNQMTPRNKTGPHSQVSRSGPLPGRSDFQTTKNCEII